MASERKIKEFLKESNAIEEVFGEANVENAFTAFTHLQEAPYINAHVIEATHMLLMYNIDPRIAGKFRAVDVRVGWKIMPSYKVVKRLVNDWCAKWEVSPPMSDLSCKVAHVEFEEIHPFEDGNGRIGRILLNIHRLKAGLPILVIKASERGEYYKWFG